MDVRRVPAEVRGSGRHRLVLCAAGLEVLLAAMLLAALAALTENAVEGGAQRRPAVDPAAVVEVSGGYRAAGGRELDRDARSALDRTYGRVPHLVRAAAPSARSTELPVVEAGGRPRADATVAVVALEGAGQHAALVSGRRPRGGGDAETAQVTASPCAPLHRAHRRQEAAPAVPLTAALGVGLGVLVVAAAGVETLLGRRRGLGAVLRVGRGDD
ncbi:hypothetical protein [Streptomyces sp. NPDC058695]|uniref:hypothetical protein n=1 Tax=Streptomyces sp. NPDC058695 TaxID=3346604 RepID=UPI00364B1F69